MRRVLGVSQANWSAAGQIHPTPSTYILAIDTLWLEWQWWAGLWSTKLKLFTIRSFVDKMPGPGVIFKLFCGVLQRPLWWVSCIRWLLFYVFYIYIFISYVCILGVFYIYVFIYIGFYVKVNLQKRLLHIYHITSFHRLSYLTLQHG